MAVLATAIPLLAAETAPGTTPSDNSAGRTLTGRIAFHRDSDNTSLHAPKTSDDGHVYIFSLNGGRPPTKVTAGRPLGNAMNPHFSPDSSCIAFMAIPTGQNLSWNHMHVYVLDLAENILRDLGTGQDPKFSPDGKFVVFKRNRQIWRATPDGSATEPLTNSAGEKSGPNYSPDGSKIVYWLNGNVNADIWCMNADGSGATPLVANIAIPDYYPIYRNSDNLLYARWDSAKVPSADKIYNLQISSGTSTRLGLNSPGGAEDADAFPVGSLVGFSSTRQHQWPDYNLYIGSDSGAVLFELSEANSSLGELGGVYSPYTHARKVNVLTPANAAALTAGATCTLEVKASSDGAPWLGANPSVTVRGTHSQTFTGLHDDGLAGDAVANDGIYSKTVVLPMPAGSYTVTANAQSVEPGITRTVSSSSATINITAKDRN